MKVQYVSISPTETANNNNCFSFTPELLAATGARYSRNNEGLDTIASKIDFSNTDKSVDSIFKMLDYGHASIADMVPIALFIDDISQYAAYYLWTLSPTAGGQECSTRYIKIDKSSLLSADELGIPLSLRKDFEKYNTLAFNNYQMCLESWTEISKEFPEFTKIPKKLLDSKDEKNKKIVDRMIRNYAFDRSRVYLPLSSKTGVMMIQSARAWSSIASILQSHKLLEFKKLGLEIAQKLSYGAPRLLKHSGPKKSHEQLLEKEFEFLLESMKTENDFEKKYEDFDDLKSFASLYVENLGYNEYFVEQSCIHRDNRYSPFGNIINRTMVKFAWLGISFGEIRDLNRHRTGSKYCPIIPFGFYTSADQLPECENEFTNNIKNCAFSFNSTSAFARNLLKNKINEYVYFTSLGHQYFFEHTTTADKFLYEMELRTGTGSHYKYAEHCKDMLNLWYEKFPSTKGLIFEGSGEPE